MPLHICVHTGNKSGPTPLLCMYCSFESVYKINGPLVAFLVSPLVS